MIASNASLGGLPCVVHPVADTWQRCKCQIPYFGPLLFSSYVILPCVRSFDALRSGKGYEPFKAYGVSKLSNVLFARELQRQLAGASLWLCLGCVLVSAKRKDAELSI